MLIKLTADYFLERSMHDKLMVYLIAVYLILIFSEIIISLVKGLKVYDLEKSLGNLSFGIGQQALGLLFMPLLILSYNYVFSNFSLGLFNFDHFTHWILFILLCDLCFYLAHSAGHHINLFVASHIVHHHAEDYNFVSALRQSYTGRIFMFPFYLPLAFLGVSTEMLVVGQILIMFVQFFSHCGLSFKKIPYIDAIFVTPRSHLVHHGANKIYQDKNCGGIFIFWDKLFGTYQDLVEGIKIKLGTSQQFNFHDPIEANTNYFKRIFFVMKNRRGLARIAILFQTPETLHKDLRRYSYSESNRKKNLKFTWTSLIPLSFSFTALMIVMKMSGESILLDKMIFATGILLGLQVFAFLLTKGKVKKEQARIIISDTVNS
jgi:alkylglycerol monooxygenase